MELATMSLRVGTKPERPARWSRHVKLLHRDGALPGGAIHLHGRPAVIAGEYAAPARRFMAQPGFPLRGLTVVLVKLRREVVELAACGSLK